MLNSILRSMSLSWFLDGRGMWVIVSINLWLWFSFICAREDLLSDIGCVIECFCGVYV